MYPSYPEEKTVYYQGRSLGYLLFYDGGTQFPTGNQNRRRYGNNNGRLNIAAFEFQTNGVPVHGIIIKFDFKDE